jgi:deoxyribose-phosphate aldolase
MIDHTILRPDASLEEVRAVVAQGAALGVASVCITADRIPLVQHGIVPLCTVVGFPSGAHAAGLKAAEAERAVEEGAVEIDMVVNLGFVADRNWTQVSAEIALVHEACAGRPLKVIVESALWENDDRLESVCKAAVDAGAEFLKTSTGMHAAGGASLGAVECLARVAAQAGREVGVKASGGVRSLDTALSMISAGATRIGTSGTLSILEALES